MSLAPPTVSLSASPNPVPEGSSVRITATLSSALSDEVRIPVTVTNVTAEAGDHNSVANWNIVISAGRTNSWFTIGTNQDTDEDDETFTAALGTLPSTVTAGSPSSVTVTISERRELSIDATPACGAAVSDTSAQPSYAATLMPAPAAPVNVETRPLGSGEWGWRTSPLWIGTSGRSGPTARNPFSQLRSVFAGFRGFEFRLVNDPDVTASCTWTFDGDAPPPTVDPPPTDGPDDPGGDDTGTDDPDPGTAELSAPERAERSFRENTGDARSSQAMTIGEPVAATAGEPLQYTLEGTDREAFTIDTDTGQLRTRPDVLYDHEQRSRYVVVVRASTATASVTTEVTITLLDVAEAPLAPQAPQVRAQAGDDTALAVAWTAPPNAGRPAITGYGVRHRAGSGAWQATPVAPGATRTQLTGLAPATRYQVQVRAMNADGYGPWSNAGRGSLGMAADAGEVEGWLVRFGRTVSDQVLEAAAERFTAIRPGFSARFAGLDFQASHTREITRPDDLTGLFGAGRTLGWAEAVNGASFSYTAATGAGGQAAFWGRGALTSFDGEEGALRLDGEAVTGLLGADLVHGPLRAGLILSHSDGDGEYRSSTDAGDLDSDLTGLYPWVHRTLGPRLSVWGLVGYGEGEIRFRPDGGTSLKADTELRMASAGVRGVLRAGEPGARPELALSSDGLYVRTESDAVGQVLAGTSAELTRLRLALEGTWQVALASGAQLRPSVQAGLRHDGGDAETGFGADLATGLAWEDPQHGIRASVRARGLLSHEDSGFEERGLSASLAWDPRPASAAGWSMTLRQTVGAVESGSLQALLHPQAAGWLASSDEQEQASQRSRLEATLGYGVLHARGQLVGTPRATLALSDTVREVRLGWRLALARENALRFGLELHGTRQEPRAGDRAPDHRLELLLAAYW
ncbi:MAG: fibronectin type III domain-containing protein [Gammaproteobacteria bacterium]|nr:fibronectin type III domain-containing protein [Gammaproteobacteria bacterium]